MKSRPDDLILSHDDITAAKDFLLRTQQQHCFAAELEMAKNSKHCKSGALGGLRIEYLNHANVIVVSGRVGERKLYPLSLKCKLTKLLVTTEHKKNGHPGVSVLLSIIGQQHYITGLKAYLKKLQRSCPKCQRANAVPMKQQMGNLPGPRISLTAPFTHTGVDFAGPLTLKEGATRRPVLYKAYLCLFICMATKAVHIEVVRTMETVDFIAALIMDLTLWELTMS